MSSIKQVIDNFFPQWEKDWMNPIPVVQKEKFMHNKITGLNRFKHRPVPLPLFTLVTTFMKNKYSEKALVVIDEKQIPFGYVEHGVAELNFKVFQSMTDNQPTIMICKILNDQDGWCPVNLYWVGLKPSATCNLKPSGKDGDMKDLQDKDHEMESVLNTNVSLDKDEMEKNVRIVPEYDE